MICSASVVERNTKKGPREFGGRLKRCVIGELPTYMRASSPGGPEGEVIEIGLRGGVGRHRSQYRIELRTRKRRALCGKLRE